MSYIRTSKQIRTMRHAKSFRSCRTCAGAPMDHLDRGSIYMEKTRLANRELYRLWLKKAAVVHISRAREKQH